MPTARGYLLAAVIGAGCTGGRARPPADPAPDQRALVGISDSVAAAVGRKDVPRLAALFADAQYVGSGFLIPPGHFAEMAGPAFQELSSITLSWRQRSVRILTADAALMTARGTNISRDARGHTASEDGLYTIVFVRGHAGWHLASIHKTTGPTIPPEVQ